MSFLDVIKPGGMSTTSKKGEILQESFSKSRGGEVSETMSGRNIYLVERKESEKLMHRGRQ